MSVSTKSVIILVAQGFEEVETLGVVDILRRGGVSVTMVSTCGNAEEPVVGGQGIAIIPDASVHTVNKGHLQSTNMIIIPGGARGSKNLAASSTVSELLLQSRESCTPMAAICGAPAVVLAPLGLLDGHRVTGYPGTERAFSSASSYVDAPVVLSQSTAGDILITSQGVGTAIPFGLKILEFLCGERSANSIAKQIVWRYS